MSKPKPPARCPCCGEEIANLSKAWEKIRGGGRQALRVPTALTATYHCGAVIAAKFIVRGTVYGSGGSQGSGAHWEIQVENGCPEMMLRALRRDQPSVRGNLFD